VFFLGENEIEKHKSLVDVQQAEARNHWNRNNVFLLVSSILLFSLANFTNIIIQIIVSGGAIFVNVCWLLIQYRSSSYTRYWKEEAKKLEQNGDVAPIYSGKIKGVEMRIMAFILPIAFIFIWAIITGVLIYNYFTQ